MRSSTVTTGLDKRKLNRYLNKNKLRVLNPGKINLVYTSSKNTLLFKIINNLKIKLQLKNDTYP